MTTQQLFLLNAFYLMTLVVVALLMWVVVALLTRATLRRIAGAFVGGAALGGVAAGIIAVSEELGWLHMAITAEPYMLTLWWIGTALIGFIFLLTWRIARRFGWRGLAVVAVIAVVIGPPRAYWFMETFPEWVANAPGVALFLAISAIPLLLGVAGHGAMRLVAGPALGSPLARWPWEVAENSAAPDPVRRVDFWDLKGSRTRPNS
jgi:hypothetical protein